MFAEVVTFVRTSPLINMKPFSCTYSCTVVVVVVVVVVFYVHGKHLGLCRDGQLT